MKILGIIPARAGSKGVPGKNSRLLGDKPLLQYSIESALASEKLSKVLLSSDSRHILSLAKPFPDVICSLRPAELASDTATSISVVMQVLEEQEQEGETYDAICLLQPTCPFRKAGSIDQAIGYYIDQHADSLVSVLPIPDEYNPHWAFEPTANGYLAIATGDAQIVSRRQDLPRSYFRDGSIYISETALVRSGTFYGKKLSFIEGDIQMHVNIDNETDWQKAEQLLPQIKDML
jgi:CMP-N,N'-diacetyllegionaminic acid synthase